MTSEAGLSPPPGGGTTPVAVDGGMPGATVAEPGPLPAGKGSGAEPGADPPGEPGGSDGGGGAGPQDPSDAKDAGASDSGPGGDAAEPKQPAPVELLPGIIAEPADDATYIYDQAEIRTYELTIAEADLAHLDRDPAAEEYVPASLRFEGTTYGNVGVRYKGSVGGFIAPCTSASLGTVGLGLPRIGKCSVKVSFREYDPDGRFYGLKKLQFHHMNRDPSMMRDRLAYQMFRESGLAAPRAVHARLLINGRLAGLFALVEQIDGRFTRSRFSEGGKGNLYKEIWPLHSDPDIYEAALETNEDEDPDVSPFVAFHEAVPQGEAALAEFIDWDTQLTFLAVDRVIVNDDGPLHFWCARGGQGNNPGGNGNHNYYWYQTEVGGRFTLIPWDMDSSFAGGEIVVLNPPWDESVSSCGCRGSQVPASCDPFVQQWIAQRDRLEAFTDAFIAGPFAADHVDDLLSTWEAQIAPHVAESEGVDMAHSVSEWQAGLARLREIISAVRASRGYPYDAGGLF